MGRGTGELNHLIGISGIMCHRPRGDVLDSKGNLVFVPACEDILAMRG